VGRVGDDVVLRMSFTQLFQAERREQVAGMNVDDGEGGSGKHDVTLPSTAELTSNLHLLITEGKEDADTSNGERGNNSL